MMTLTVSGNLGSDAELRTIASGKQVLNFSVAGKNGRDKDSAPTWIRCAVWGARGAALANYLKKGTSVVVVGALSVREHNGKTHHDLDVHDVEMFGGKPSARQEPDDERWERPRKAASDDIPF